MKYYDVYGSRAMPIDAVRSSVGSALGVAFERRYHDDIGDYFEADVDGENFLLQPNFLDVGDEEEIQEPEFADRPVLLYVSDTDRGDEIRDLLLEVPGLEHLRRDTRE